MDNDKLLELYLSNEFNVSSEEDILGYYSSVSDDLIVLYSVELSTRLGINPSISHTIIDLKSTEHLLVISELKALCEILKISEIDFNSSFINVLNSSNPLDEYIKILELVNIPIKRKTIGSALLKDIRAKIRLQYDLPLTSSLTGKQYKLNLKGLSVMYSKLVYSYIMASTKSCLSFYSALKGMLNVMYSNFDKIKEFNDFLDDNCNISGIKSPSGVQFESIKQNILNKLSSLLQLGDSIEPVEGLGSIVDELAGIYDALSEQAYKDIYGQQDYFMTSLISSMPNSEFKQSIDFSKYNRQRDRVISEYNKIFKQE